ncbi:MAG: preprotein translocase subunit SecG [Prevotella sp.]|jgi:preprotein translocase subunit SecG|nr:preprotein translocase subunit SecG [Prevotella sp.]
MNVLITVLIVLAAIALILVVLVQKSKGGGLASGFASSNQIMGVRKTTDFIEKATWGLAGTIVVLSLISAVLVKGGGTAAPIIEVQAPTLPAPTATPDVTTTLPMPAGAETAPQTQPVPPQQ